MKTLKTALLGVSRTGADYLQAILADEQFELVAVADNDPEAMRLLPDLAPARCFEDYRSLVIETAHAGLDVLFVALEPESSGEFVEMAAQRGVTVFRKTPPARSVRELDRLATHFAPHAGRLIIARPWLFDPAFSLLRNPATLAAQVQTASVEVRTMNEPTGWRADARRAGGGVLLYGAYDAVDMLVYLLGLPESVYAQTSTRRTDRVSPAYDTEDVAAVTLRFEGGQLGTLIARRGAARADWQITLGGKCGRVVLREEGITTDPLNTEIMSIAPKRSANIHEPVISAFGAALLSGMPLSGTDPNEHAKTLATIEAAYLSSRTGVPESPGHLIGLRAG